MSFKIMNYLVLDSGVSMSSMRISKNHYRYTEEGMLLYPIKSVVPVIARGKGCIGTALIKSLNIDENTTSVQFEFVEVDKNTARVLYSLYMNNSTMQSGSDGYDPYNQDIVLPGAVSAPKVNLAEKIDSRNNDTLRDIMRTVSGGERRKNREIGGFYDDYDDEDDY